MTRYGYIDLGQRWLWQWIVDWRHQAITWTNVDLSSARPSDIHLRKIFHELAWKHLSTINWVICGSDNGLLPDRHQAITDS